jgi:hypothetical protein
MNQLIANHNSQDIELRRRVRDAINNDEFLVIERLWDSLQNA